MANYFACRFLEDQEKRQVAWALGSVKMYQRALKSSGSSPPCRFSSGFDTSLVAS